jgi:proteinaceous RNase P
MGLRRPLSPPSPCRYWLYATVRAKSRGLLVSNDLLRDHIFQLLRPKHFIKWSERHVARYTFTPDARLSLQYPAPFTACVQQLPNGAWMVPRSDGTWLCAQPVAQQ